MTLEEVANDKYDRLTANDREMLECIFREKAAVRTMNSTQLASFLHVSRTTLARLVKKLDVGSFSEFKLLLGRKEELEMEHTFDMEAVVRDYHRMIDELKKNDYSRVCRRIDQADTIYLFGTGNEQKAIAEEFKRIFLTLGKYCVDLFDPGEVASAAQRMDEKDLLLVISLSGETREALQVVRTARETGIQTLSLTRWANNTLARMCQSNLYVGTKTLQKKSSSYEMVAAFYILLDILSVRYLEYKNGYGEDEKDEDR